MITWTQSWILTQKKKILNSSSGDRNWNPSVAFYRAGGVQQAKAYQRFANVYVHNNTALITSLTSLETKAENLKQKLERTRNFQVLHKYVVGNQTEKWSTRLWTKNA